jgi:hypothetical protein
MPTFAQTTKPTPYGFYDNDIAFQSEADSFVFYTKRSLGEDLMTVELTSKQIWSCLEDAVSEYARHVNEIKIQSDIVSVLGMPTGSVDMTNTYPRQSLEFFNRLADPYSTEAFVGGSYDAKMGYIQLVLGQQDYNLYTDLIDPKTNLPLSQSVESGKRSKLKIVEVFHFEPLAAQQFLLNASNMTSFLAQNFNFESYVNSTVFYVLPIFEDVLRRGMLEAAFRVRRSHYSYEMLGTNIRFFPIPTGQFQTGKLWIKSFVGQLDPFNPGYQDDSIHGISGPNNVPFSNLQFSTINQPGRQWIRKYAFARCRELLGIIRSKFSTIPVPNAEITLDGEKLRQEGQEEQVKLTESLKEWLTNFTTAKLAEQQVSLAESLNKQLSFIPMPKGAIYVG